MDFEEHGLGVHPIAALALMNSNVVEDAMATDNLKPISWQYDMGPGDFAVMAGTNADLDSQVIVGELLNPEEHVQDFPDWATRIQNSYVLVRYFATTHPEDPEIGWFSRVKLIRLDREQRDTMLAWLKDGLPETMPDWLRDKYATYTQELSALSPGLVPSLVECPKCGTVGEMILRMEHTTKYIAQPGTLIRDDEQVYVPLGNNEEYECDTSANLHCLQCHATGELDAETEINYGRNSTLFKLLGHHHQ